MAAQRPPKQLSLVPDPELLKHQISAPRWDLYTATGLGDVTHDEFLDVIESALGPVAKVPAWGGKFYEHRLDLIKERRTIGHIAWGGIDAMHPKLEVTGSITPPVVNQLRQSMSGRYQVPAFHSCVDYLGGRAVFLLAQKKAEEVQWMKMPGRKPRLVPRYDKSFPADPWAFEFGSKKNTYINMYEKPEEDPDMVRAELRSRFKGAGKLMAAQLDAHEAWGVAQFTQKMAALMFDPNIQRHRCRTVPEKTPVELKMCKAGNQYSKSVLAFISAGHSTTELGDLIYAAALTKSAIQNAKKKHYPLGSTNMNPEEDVLALLRGEITSDQ